MNFQYSGKRLSGQKVKGQIDADTRQAALVKLEQSGLIILRIEETKPWNKDIILNKRIKNKDFVIFLRQYATLIHAGISISDATKTMIMQTGNYALRTALTDMDKQLDQGQALSKAASRHPKVFPSLLVNMIHAGEASGKLDDILNQMADYYEKEYRNKQKIISALLYPAVVGIVTLVLSIFLLVFIVPQFVTMFRSFGEDLPAYTKFVLSLSEWAGLFWWLVPVLGVLGFILYKYFIQYDSFRYRIDVGKLKFPFIGVLVHKGALVRMTQTLSTLVNSAVPILEAVGITEKVVGNRVIEEVLVKARDSLEVGESITEPMKKHWAFPALIIQMIQIGEKTGTLDHMLTKAAEFYEEEVEQLSNRIKTLIEPLMIIILTVIVGGIITAVVIPMFSLFENIQ
ncbi:type II secretion system F family protein [Virgibacillus halodenitrificans]|uniref:Type II secretion system F family protein n=1 Tax=Virgibacillus halodenitrificans TaxID=1482 RepID=A0ABR7VQI4_VIRHA|nr:type II secretion system F family protein [Virgibacillus halodenitrificans]MBD1223928.1 type II secretion system F family protein [Virgibacillus halodenitrificans]